MKKMIAFVVGIAVALCIGTAGAYFTGETMVAENVIRAGTVEVSCEPTESALSMDGLAPGSSMTRVLSVHNDGTLAQTFVVTEAKKMGITDFYESLQVKATHGTQVVYDGPLMGMNTSEIALDPGETTDVSFEVELPAGAGDDLAGDYVKLTLYVDAEQAH